MCGATATFTCKRDASNIRTVGTDITGETKESAETENGEIKYTETVMFDDTNYTDIKTVVLPDAGTVSPKA